MFRRRSVYPTCRLYDAEQSSVPTLSAKLRPLAHTQDGPFADGIPVLSRRPIAETAETASGNSANGPHARMGQRRAPAWSIEPDGHNQRAACHAFLIVYIFKSLFYMAFFSIVAVERLTNDGSARLPYYEYSRIDYTQGLQFGKHNLNVQLTWEHPFWLGIGSQRHLKTEALFSAALKIRGAINAATANRKSTDQRTSGRRL